MFSGCFTALKSQTTETSPHKDALGKNVLLKVNSLQSFKKGLNYKQNDFQRVKEHKVSGTVIKSNFLFPVCFISPEIEVQKKKEKENLFVFSQFFCYSTMTTQTWEWHWSSLGGDNRTGTFPEKIINITSLCALQGWTTVFGAARISKLTSKYHSFFFWLSFSNKLSPRSLSPASRNMRERRRKSRKLS